MPEPATGPDAAPTRATRLDPAPRPVLRLLSEVLVELRAATGPGSASVPAPVSAPVPPPDPDRAAAEARPFAARVLGALAEVLDGRRPVAHLSGVCPAADAERLAAHVVRRQPGERGTPARVSGLRLCGVDDDAVEVAAVLAGPTRSRAVCGRITRAPGTRSGWRLASLAIV